jgi:phosphoenolpyruvate carboxykinase (GTP)
VDTPIGFVPTLDSLDVAGVDVTPADMAELLDVDVDEWRAEVPSIREYFAMFGERLPDALHQQVDLLESRLG